MNKKISIVIPVYNEESNIEYILKEIKNEVEKVTKNYELIVVDDGSTDNSWEIIKKFGNVKGIRFSRNFGKDFAIIAGLEYARGDAAVIIDADGQHPPGLIPKMIELWENKKVLIVEGVKEKRGKENIFKKIGTRLFFKIIKTLSGIDLKGKSDFKLIDRKALNYFRDLKERNIFFRGMTEWFGLEKLELPFIPEKRKKGKTKWSFIKILKYGINNIVSFSSALLYIVTFAGLIFLIFSLILSIQTFYMKFSGKSASGFTTVIILLLLIGSFIMISLGIIGLYIARIYEEVKGRPRYVIKETFNLKEKNNY